MSIIGAVRTGLKRAGNTPDVVEAFTNQAMDGDYDHLLRVALAFTSAASGNKQDGGEG